VGRSIVRLLVTSLLVLTAPTPALVGCASSNNYDNWQRVGSGHLSGERPSKVVLGVYDLGNSVRVAWDLSGPQKPPATLKLNLTNAGAATDAEVESVTFDAARDPIPRHTDGYMNVILVPGKWRIAFSQSFRRSQGPGFDIDFTVYTMNDPRLPSTHDDSGS
jgi:hypothetical protein